MQYRRMGTTGLQVSAVSIGGWLTFGGSVADDEAGRILRAALDGGVNFVDLADVYALGRAEEVAGRHLKDLPRHELVLSSKVFGKMSDDVNDRGLSRKHVMESVERSLKRLGTDYLDLYFCHREDPDTPLEETVRAMDDLVHQGKVLYWGTSCWSPDTLRRAHALADRRGCYAPMVEQPEYNLLVRDVEREVLPTAQALGMGVVCWSPLASGALTGKYDDGIPEGSRAATTKFVERHLGEDGLARLRAFSDLAREAGMEPSTLALAMLLRRPELTSVITGASRAEQLAPSLAAADVDLDEALAARVLELFPVAEA